MRKLICIFLIFILGACAIFSICDGGNKKVPQKEEWHNPDVPMDKKSVEDLQKEAEERSKKLEEEVKKLEEKNENIN